MRILVASLLVLGSTCVMGQSSPPTSPAAASGMVTASGTLPDEATKADVLDRLRRLYGNDHVIDQITVGGVVAPANWNRYVSSMINPNLKQVTHGKIQIQGDAIDITGEVPNEAVRQQVLSELSTSFDANYRIKQNLRIGASRQSVLDQTLANRTVQFQSASAILTPAGRAILDEMATAILKLDNPGIDIVGNTDNQGNRQSNIALSLSRAHAVKDYLVNKGIPAAGLAISGQGPDNPIADNTTETGRARNRRIDFKVSAGR